MNKTAIFIDGANLYGGMKKHDPYMQIDFIKLSKELTGNRQIIRVYYYTAPPILQQNPTDDQKNEYSKTLHFIESLKLLPYFKVKIGSRSQFTYKEKGVDVYLATDMLSLAYKNGYDVAVLVSGDADYVPVVEEVQGMGKIVEVACFSSSKSVHLRQVCDKFINLDNIALKFIAAKIIL